MVMQRAAGPAPSMRADARFRLISWRNYLGPNIYAMVPVARQTVDLGPWGTQPVARRRPAFFERLAADAPDCIAAVRAGCDPEKTLLATLVALLARELQRASRARVDLAIARRTTEPSVFNLLVGFEEPEIGAASLRYAIGLVDLALAAETGGTSTLDGPRMRAQFDHIVASFQIVHTARFQIREAERRGIPHHRLFPHGSIVQLGHGCRQRRLSATVNDRSSAIAHTIATDKIYTSLLLASAGLPVPRQILVQTVGAAISAAEELGFPVVVKAARVDKGGAVITDLRDRDAVAAAFHKVERHGRILVEKHVPGDDHRFLVIKGRMVAAARRRPASVVGDGRNTVRELVRIANLDQRRSVGDAAPELVRITIDDEALRLLRREGLDLDQAPEDGVVVALRGNANVSTGGTSEDVTARVHPEVRRTVEEAARLVGVEVAGIDLLTADVSRPLSETGGAICEVNQSPGLRPHVVDPGSPDVVGAVVDNLFPAGANGRIPLAAVTGTNGKTTTVRMVARILREMGLTVGSATTATVEIDDRVLARGDLAGPPGARMILQDPAVEAAVLETARGGIVNYGLGFDRCSVGAVLNVGDDHVGIDGVTDRQMLADAKGLVVRTASRLAVLNARDPLCVAMKAITPAGRCCFVSTDPRHPLVGDGLPPGDIAATLAGQDGDARIVMRVDGCDIPVARVSEIPAADGGRAQHNVENALFAAAIAWGMGAGPGAIAAGLARYDLSWATAQGRLSIHDGLPFRVVVDYGHNGPAIAALRAWAQASDVRGRRICMLNAPGNRIDAHYLDIAKAAAGGFDAYVCTGPDDTRGRAPGEVARRLARALVDAGVPQSRIGCVPDEVVAVPYTLRASRPGDLVILFCHNPARSWDQVRSHRPAG